MQVEERKQVLHPLFTGSSICQEKKQYVSCFQTHIGCFCMQPPHLLTLKRKFLIISLDVVVAEKTGSHSLLSLFWLCSRPFGDGELFGGSFVC